MSCCDRHVIPRPPRAIFRLLLLTGFLLILTASTAPAWYTLHHPIISNTALAELPEAMQTALSPYRDQLLWGAMSPDTLRDWPHHDWNLHSQTGDNTDAPDYIADLADDIINQLRQTPNDMASIAEQLGRLSHYLADLSQPLHSDDYNSIESTFHVPYELQAYTLLKTDLESAAPGLRLHADIRAAAVAAASEANFFYEAILNSYDLGDDFSRVRNLTSYSLRQALANVRDVWASIWYRAFNQTSTIALSLNQNNYRPGDMIQLEVSAIAESINDQLGDLYLALADHQGNLTFLLANGDISPEPRPYQTAIPLADSGPVVLYNLPLGSTDSIASYQLYAVVTQKGGSPLAMKYWLTNLATVTFSITPLPEPAQLLAELNDEPYLLPAVSETTEQPLALPLRRWDLVFVGGKQDDPQTPEDEEAYNNLIPGRYTHAMLYLGRDHSARPVFVELIASHTPYLRLVRLAETAPPYPDGIYPRLPVASIKPTDYRHRWAARLQPSDRLKADLAQTELFMQLVADLTTDIPYQLEYNWSGNFLDFQIELIDDGRANGSSCTDYLLTLFEENAGICLSGSRINAADVIDYFRFDPEGSTALIPDLLNPFPFSMTMSELLNLGYAPVNPPPHLSPCGGLNETGVPTPSRLRTSTDLNPIAEVPLPAAYLDAVIIP